MCYHQENALHQDWQRARVFNGYDSDACSVVTRYHMSSDAQIRILLLSCFVCLGLVVQFLPAFVWLKRWWFCASLSSHTTWIILQCCLLEVVECAIDYISEKQTGRQVYFVPIVGGLASKRKGSASLTFL
jgi:hypothetical protein